MPFPFRHTHDRVDQFFSRVSIRLDQGDIRTIADLERAVKECYTPSPSVQWLEGVLNIQEWMDPYLPNAGQVKGITEHQFYTFYRDPNSQGPVKAVVQSRFYSDSEETSRPCHLLLGVPQTKPTYVASRPLFHSKSTTPEGRREWFLMMKQQVLDIAERSKWNDEVVGQWEKDFKWLDELQSRGVTNFEGFWPADSNGSKEALQQEIRSFFEINSDFDDLPDLVADFDYEIEQAAQKERFILLAEKEEALKVSFVL